MTSILRRAHARGGRRRGALCGPFPALGWAAALLSISLSACAPAYEEAHHDDDHHHDHGGARIVHLSDEQRALAGVSAAPVMRSALDAFIDLPGEVRFDEDLMAHAGVRAAGAIARLHAGEGDRVAAGQVLAEIDMREFADARAARMGARAGLDLAEAEYARMARLRDSDAASQQDYQRARQMLEAARIELARAEQQIEALGQPVSGESGASSARYALRAPISGLVIARQAVLGEMLELENPKPIFIIADSSRVWIDARIAGAAPPALAEGDVADIDPGDGGAPLPGRILFVSPDLDPGARAMRLRIAANNADGRLRPGQFVTARVRTGAQEETLSVPDSALTVIDGESAVFVEESDGEYEVRPVRLERRADGRAEILAGLSEGERVVTQGAFTLRAELEKDGFDDGHDH